MEVVGVGGCERGEVRGGEGEGVACEGWRWEEVGGLMDVFVFLMADRDEAGEAGSGGW